MIILTHCSSISHDISKNFDCGIVYRTNRVIIMSSKITRDVYFTLTDLSCRPCSLCLIWTSKLNLRTKMASLRLLLLLFGLMCCGGGVKADSNKGADGTWHVDSTLCVYSHCRVQCLLSLKACQHNAIMYLITISILLRSKLQIRDYYNFYPAENTACITNWKGKVIM